MTPLKSETDPRLTRAVEHDDPLADEERKRTIGALVGYSDAPRLDAGVPSASTRLPGSAIAAAPAPTQPLDR
jgi:hypothetical protein